MENNSNSFNHVSARETMGLLKAGAILVDVRQDYELGRLFDVEPIVYCSYDDIKDHLDEFPKDKALIFADAVGLRSKEVAMLFVENGFTTIYNLAGGIVDWDRSGFPVTTDKNKMYSGQCMCQLKIRNKTK